jgi:hypothetical protein
MLLNAFLQLRLAARSGSVKDRLFGWTKVKRARLVYTSSLKFVVFGAATQPPRSSECAPSARRSGRFDVGIHAAIQTIK